MQILAFACMLPLFQSPLAITTEIATLPKRGLVIGWACIAWSVGVCALPLVAWLINQWKALQLVCTIPLLFVFACWKIIPESPRWMVTKGQTAGAREIMEKIATANKAKIPEDLQETLEEMAQ